MNELHKEKHKTKETFCANGQGAGDKESALKNLFESQMYELEAKHQDILHQQKRGYETKMR